jgi:hypothetical protein
MITVLCLSIAGSFFIIKNNSSTFNSNGMGQMTAPGNSNNQSGMMPPGSSNSSNQGSSSNSTDQSSSSSSSSSSNSNQPPTRPDGNNSNGQMPSGAAPSGMPGKMDSKNSSNWSYYVILGITNFISISIIIYLIMSKFNKKSFKETLSSNDKKVIFGLISIILAAGLVVGENCIASNVLNNKTTSQPTTSQSSNTTTATGNTTVNGTTQTLSSNYSSTKSDESAVLVQNGGTATLNNTTVTKSGDSTNTENSEFYGINSAVLVTKGSKATINNATIKTTSKGSNAVFSTGTDSKIYINNSSITTTGSSSARGLDATYGGYIEANKVTIKTSGGSCAALATDRGEGTVIAKNSTLETNGAGSPVIYSTGDISIENTTGNANGAQMVVIEGKNKATVTNSTLTASGKGNRGDIDQAGVMIYQSMSGDASTGTGNFTATNSTLSISKDSSYYKTAPMFFITNTNAVINLTNTNLNFGSNTLIKESGTTAWGTSGSNGGTLTLNASKQTLKGNIDVDKISSLTLNLKNSSNYEGTINSANSAKNIKLVLDKTSKITLTGNSYVSSLSDADSSYSNIDFNGYKLYVNGTSIN